MLSTTSSIGYRTNSLAGAWKHHDSGTRLSALNVTKPIKRVVLLKTSTSHQRTNMSHDRAAPEEEELLPPEEENVEVIEDKTPQASKEDIKVPVIDEETVPALEKTDISIAEEGRIPVLEEQTMPVSAEEEQSSLKHEERSLPEEQKQSTSEGEKQSTSEEKKSILKEEKQSTSEEEHQSSFEGEKQSTPQERQSSSEGEEQSSSEGEEQSSSEGEKQPTSEQLELERFEEEGLLWYSPEQFYPVRIGEVFEEKYRVVGKLGYGAHSTVWLCRNLQDDSFAALKTCTLKGSHSADREVDFYKHVGSITSEHPWQNYIRGLFEVFTIKSSSGEHLCLVHPPMHMTIRELQLRNSSRRLTPDLLRWTLRNVLKALSFLNDEAGVVHTDINPSNIMLTIDDESLLVDFERDEAEVPSPTKIIDDRRTIYGSRKLGLPKDSLWGQPVLCDFSEARIGPVHKGMIQPGLYRAPEVLFEMGWTSSVDTWNVAALIWDLFEYKHMFQNLDEGGDESGTVLVSYMVAYLGLPPPEYVQRSEVTRNVFDENGKWIFAGVTDVPGASLEQEELYLEGEDKRQFLEFVTSMLKWLPEERKTATELLEDPWLKAVAA